MLIFTIVIHGPDFFVAASIADKSNLRGRDSRQAAGKFSDDFIRELVRESAHLRFGRLSTIYFSYHWRKRSVADVIQPGLNLNIVSIHGKSAKREQLRRGRCPGPRLVIDFGGHRGRLERVVTLAHQLEDAAVVQIRAQYVAEKCGERLGRGIFSGKIRNANS